MTFKKPKLRGDSSKIVTVYDTFPDISLTDENSKYISCRPTLKDKAHNLNRHLEHHHADVLLQLLHQKKKLNE